MMYGYGGYTSGPELNNPFINDPTNAQSRFPDISGTSDPSSGQYTSWVGGGNQAFHQPQPQQQAGFYQQSPSYQQQQPLGYNPTGFASSPPPFQPTSSFGQQLTAQVNGSGYGYLTAQPTSAQPQTAYNPVQQQLQSNPGYIAQFDPYASLGQLDRAAGLQQQRQQPRGQMVQSPTQGSFPPLTVPTAATSTGPNGQPHPRDYVRTHKLELEAWDTYAWKQVLGAFETLKEAWGTRKKEVEARATQLRNQLQYGGVTGYYAEQVQHEGVRLQGLFKEADSNFASVAASTFQMQEVFQGYRQSGDISSKRRVREACNAALQGLPDWPSQSF